MKKFLSFFTACAAAFTLAASPATDDVAQASKRTSPPTQQASMSQLCLDSPVSNRDLPRRPMTHAEARARIPRGMDMATTPVMPATRRTQAPPLFAPGGVQLFGVLTHLDSWSSFNTAEGFYTFTTTSGVMEQIYKCEAISTTGFYADGIFYTPFIMDLGFMKLSNFIAVNPETKRYDTVDSQFTTAYDMYSATYVPSLGAGLSYGKQNSDNSNVLMTISLTGQVTKVADLGSLEFQGGLTVSAKGTIYGMTGGGDLYTISLPDYTCTKVGSSGVPTFYSSCIMYDDRNGVIYYPTSPETDPSAFYSVNPATAQATKLYDFAENLELRCLYTPPAQAADEAPGKPTIVSTSFPDGGLTGTLTFLPPTDTYNGEPGSGEIDYTVEADGLKVTEGKTSYGAEAVDVAIKFETGGSHMLRLYCSNSAGNSEAVSTTIWVGPDKPLPANNVKLEYADGTMTLTWDPVQGENGGYIDQNSVTYTILRKVGSQESVEVISGHKSTTYTQAYPEPEGRVDVVSYFVRAVYTSVLTDFSPSNKVMIGWCTPPYEDNFATAESLDNYLVIDANNDGKTWNYDADKKTVYCAYDANNHANDYLVLPAQKLEKGKIYFISFVAGTVREDYEERVALYVGRSPEAQTLTQELIAPTTFTTPYTLTDDGPAGTDFECQFTPEEDGVYYFAVKGCSDPYMYRMFVGNLKISGANSAGAPGLATGLLFTPDDTGEPIVTIEFDAPTVDVNNDELTSIDYIDIYRGDELVKRERNVKPGDHVTVTDTEAGEGNVTYNIQAVNAIGEGLTLTGTVYVGFSVPLAPTGVDLKNGSDLGEVVVSWPAVTTDINGLILPEVTYTVTKRGEKANDWEVIASGLSETSFTTRACAPEAEQDFAQYAVYATNHIGNSEMKASQLICVGAPYSMPYRESFAFNPSTLQLNSILGIISINGGGGWSSATDDTFADLQSQDEDNAFICFVGMNEGDCARTFTGRIHVDQDAVNPEFSFHYFCVSPADRNLVQVLVNDGSGFVDIIPAFTAGTGTPGEWNRMSVSLGAYRGKDVQIGLQVTTVNMRSTAFDNIQVKDQATHDLAVEVRAASSVSVGQNLAVTVNVMNYGTMTEQDWSVSLEADYKVVETRTGDALAPGKTQSITFNLPVGAAQAEELILKANVICPGDTELSNNHTEPLSVTVIRPTLPAATDLKGELGANDEVVLTWSAPQYEAKPQPYTETFESADPFATMSQGHTAGWTFLDLDEAGIGGLQDLDIPNVPYASKQSFFILDQSHPDFNYSFAGHDGSSKMLAAVYNARGEQNDDWAISPELNGKAQTISFFARAYDTANDETIEVLYSTTDKNPESFTSVRSYIFRADGQRRWAEYSFEVPEGAKYFALRYRSTDEFLVLIDDVTFIPAGAEPLDLKGYNVYRDGVLLNSEPVSGTTYTDTENVSGARYVVTAVYNYGESAACEPVYPRGNSVEEIAADLRVTGEHGAIAVSGTEQPVTVADMQGRVVYSGNAGRIPAATGAYIVRIGRQSFKVLVK